MGIRDVNLTERKSEKINIKFLLQDALGGWRKNSEKIVGVKYTTSGYAGGWFEYRAYKQVCTNRRGHAEAIEIMYYQCEIGYADLLEVFWLVHNPTTNNR